MTEKRRCAAKTKAGKPCRSQPMKDRDVCLSHADEQTRANASFGGPENGAKGGHAKRVPRLLEVLAAKVEEDIERWLAPLERAIEADRAVVVGNGPSAHVELHPDHPIQVAATREVLDRLTGKPRQTTEVTGAGGQPLVPPALPTDADWHRDVKRALLELGAPAPEAVAGNGSSNGKH